MGDADRTEHDRTQPGMSASVVASTIVFAMSHGVSIEAISDATGLQPSDWIDRDARLPNAAAGQVWKLLRQARPGQALALDMAKAAPFSYFGPLAYGAQYAPDLRAALATFMRFRGILSDELSAELRDGDPVAVVFSHPSDALDGGMGAEAGVAVGARFLREVLGMPRALVGARFSHAAIGPTEAYEAYFGVPVAFSAGETALLLDPRWLEEPLPAQDATLFDYIRAHLDLARSRIAVEDELGPVRQAIADNAARGEYSAERLARSMGMSLRVLQRRVSEQGTTVRALLDEAREVNARELLGDDRLSVEEVAFLLGYSDERAFRRAFKRLTGTSPAAFRRARR